MRNHRYAENGDPENGLARVLQRYRVKSLRDDGEHVINP